MKKLTIALAILFVLGLVGSVAAVKTVPKRQVQLKKQQGWLSSIASYFRRRALTVVGGKICQKHPDDDNTGEVVYGVPIRKEKKAK